MTNNIRKPIGLIEPCSEIESNCKKAMIFKKCGLRPDHMIIPLDPGSGRTTLLEYMADMYKATGVLDFSGSIDDYIEITFDGSMSQLKEGFEAINSAADYSNNYSNILGVDISGIATHFGETQCSEFLAECEDICKYASVVFFIHSNPTKNEVKLSNKIREAIPHIKYLDCKPYTIENICELIHKKLDDYGITIKDDKSFYEALLYYVKTTDITTVKEAVSISEKLARLADFTEFEPVIDEGSIKSLTKDEDKAERR